MSSAWRCIYVCRKRFALNGLRQVFVPVFYLESMGNDRASFFELLGELRFQFGKEFWEQEYIYIVSLREVCFEGILHEKTRLPGSCHQGVYPRPCNQQGVEVDADRFDPERFCRPDGNLAVSAAQFKKQRVSLRTNFIKNCLHGFRARRNENGIREIGIEHGEREQENRQRNKREHAVEYRECNKNRHEFCVRARGIGPRAYCV